MTYAGLTLNPLAFMQDFPAEGLPPVGEYIVWAPSNNGRNPFLTGNYAILKVFRISNGMMGQLDGSFYFDAQRPTKYVRIVTDDPADSAEKS